MLCTNILVCEEGTSYFSLNIVGDYSDHFQSQLCHGDFVNKFSDYWIQDTGWSIPSAEIRRRVQCNQDKLHKCSALWNADIILQLI